MVVHTALGHLDILIRFFDYHDGVAGLLGPIVDHVACPDILPAGIIDSPPWQAAEGSIGAQHSPARAVVAVAERPVQRIIRTVGRWIFGTMRIDFFQCQDGRLYVFLRERRGSRRTFLLVVLDAVDVDTVGGGIVGYAEVYSLADIPEPDIVAAANQVGSKADLFTVQIKCLGGGTGP